MTTLMTVEAIANDQQLGNPLVPVREIFCDHEFNCRGWFSPTTCIELAKDIAKRGLQQPIIVRKLRAEKIGMQEPDTEALESGFKFKIIAGHRRFTAYTINEAETIPAIIRDADISEWEEKDVNAIENLQREELNFLQEANAIRHYWMAGWNRPDIADRVGKSQGWVQLRCILLEMPDQIQQAAGQGYIKPGDMHELNRLKDPTKMLEAAGILVDSRRKGEKNPLSKLKRPSKPSEKRVRKKTEIFAIQEVIATVCALANREEAIYIKEIVTRGGNSLATRVLGWCAGEITEYELHDSIREFCRTIDVEYTMPEFDEDG